jgi:ribokinase
VLLLQREIPEFVNAIAAKFAKENGVMVILDVGGRDELLSKDLLANVDIISPNETELERVIHKKVNNEQELKIEIKLLLKEYPNLKILLKEGENGSSLYY